MIFLVILLFMEVHYYIQKILKKCKSGIVQRLGYTVLIRGIGVRFPVPEFFSIFLVFWRLFFCLFFKKKMENKNNLDDIEIEQFGQNKSKSKSSNKLFMLGLLFGLIVSILLLIFFRSLDSFYALQWIVGILSIFFYFVTYWSDNKKLKTVSFSLMIFCVSIVFFTIFGYLFI